MEKRKRVDTYQVELVCDICPGQTGKMIPTGEALMSYPAQYPHACNQCGTIVNIRGRKYPYIDYVVRG